MIEIYKHQFKDLSKCEEVNITGETMRSLYIWMILSSKNLIMFLNIVIEGGVETKPDNILIYATSNRRHLIKET